MSYVIAEIMEYLRVPEEQAEQIFYNMDIDFSECEQFEFEDEIDRTYALLEMNT